MSDAGRPQDQGRKHRKRAAPSAATASLLERWQATKREELADVIRKLRPEPDGQLGLDGKPVPPAPLPISTRTALIDLGIKIERSLAGEVDEPPDPDAAPPSDPTIPPKSTRRGVRYD